MKRTFALILLFCSATYFGYAQGSPNLFTGDPIREDTNAGQYLFLSRNFYSGGVCDQYAGACSALVDDYVFFDKNPAVSSLIYSGPFVGISHRDYALNASVQTIGFAHAIEQFGFGAGLRYMHSVINSYDANRVWRGVFSPTELLFGLNFSYNFLRQGIIDGISLGINLKGAVNVIPLNSISAVDRAAFFTDIGAIIHLHAFKLLEFANPNVGIALTYRNLGGTFTNEAVFNPGSFLFGIAYAPIPHLLITSDTEFDLANLGTVPPENTVSTSIGIGVRPIDILEIGAGFHYDASQYFFTAGISVLVLGVQIRFVQHFDVLTNFIAFDNFSISVSLKVQNTIAPERRLSIQKLYLQALQAFLAEDLDTALSIVENALLISPNYRPTLELKRQIISLQEINELLN